MRRYGLRGKTAQERRKNIGLLSACQALLMTHHSIIIDATRLAGLRCRWKSAGNIAGQAVGGGFLANNGAVAVLTGYPNWASLFEASQLKVSRHHELIWRVYPYRE